MSLFLFSCSHSGILKRRYQSGYFIQNHSINRKSETNTIANKVKFEKPTFNLEAPEKFESKDPSLIRTIQSCDLEPTIKSGNVLSYKKEPVKNKFEESQYSEEKVKSLVKNNRIKISDKNDIINWSIFSFTISLGLTGLFLRKKERVKKISKWATRNRVKTKFAIAFFVILNSISSFIIGQSFYLNHVKLPDHLTTVSASAFFLTALLYPKRTNILFEKKLYIKRKVSDFLLMFFSSIMMISGSYDQKINNSIKQILTPNTVQESLMYNPSTVKNNNNSKLFEKIDLPKALKVENAKMKWWQILSIFFIVLTAFACTIAVAALSCSISCSGNQGLANLVLIGGTALSMFLCIFGIVQIAKIKITPKSS